MSRRGAALVEALVSLVIVVVLAASAGSAAVLGLRADALAARQSRALVLLEQVLERVACGELEVEETEDEIFDETDEYIWSLTIESTDHENVEALTATVSWEAGGGFDSMSATRWLYRGAE